MRRVGFFWFGWDSRSDGDWVGVTLLAVVWYIATFYLNWRHARSPARRHHPVRPGSSGTVHRWPTTAGATRDGSTGRLPDHRSRYPSDPRGFHRICRTARLESSRLMTCWHPDPHLLGCSAPSIRWSSTFVMTKNPGQTYRKGSRNLRGPSPLGPSTGRAGSQVQQMSWSGLMRSWKHRGGSFSGRGPPGTGLYGLERKNRSSGGVTHPVGRSNAHISCPSRAVAGQSSWTRV